MSFRHNFLVDRLDSYGVGAYRRFFVWVIPTVRYVTSRRFHRPTFTVLISGYEHEYVQNMRAAVGGAVLFVPIPQWRQYAVPIKFIRADIFHLHFVEALDYDLEQTTSLIAQLKAARIKIVWTAHDLTPHSKQPDKFDPIFSAWAGAADGVIHHSHFGERLLRQRYAFGPDTVHTVITNRRQREHAGVELVNQRSSIEAEWGLTPTPLRIGLVGGPRVERKVMNFLRGVTLSTSEDFQVVCWSLGPGEIPPRDPRIAIAEAYRFASDEIHARRLAICDLVALPVDPDGEMLTTGVVPDAIAVGLGILASDWGYLKETCGDAAIACGHTPESVAECLNTVTMVDVRVAKDASRALRESWSWESARQPMMEFYHRVVNSTDS